MNDIERTVGDDQIELYDSTDRASHENYLKELARNNPLFQTEMSMPLVMQVLADGEQRFLGKGNFSSVYAINEARVVKFCWDLPTLQLLQRLAASSSYFPMVYEIFENQAKDQEEVIFHAAVVERLQESRPMWVRDIVNAYCQPCPVTNPIQAYGRLIEIGRNIRSGTILVPPEDQTGFATALEALAGECLTAGLIADLRIDLNFLRRPGGHVVIADPAHPYNI